MRTCGKPSVSAPVFRPGKGPERATRGSRFFVALLATLALAGGSLALGAIPAAAANEVSTEVNSITNVSYASAHVVGTVHGGNSAIVYYWEYSDDGQNWTLAERSIPLFGGDRSVETDITGLKGGTRYFVRLGVEQIPGGDSAYSPEPYPEFTTLVADPPTVERVDAPTQITYTTASVSGEVVRPAASNDLSCAFEYVTDAQFTASGFADAGVADCGTVSVVGPSPVATQLSGLTSGTTYHLRLSVSNASHTATKEAASTFETKPATAPTLSVSPATEVTYTTAQVSGSIDPEGGNEEAGAPTPIYWEFQYSQDPVNFGWSSGSAFPGGSGTIEAPQAGESDPIPVATKLEFLQNAAEYKFRLIAYYPGKSATSGEGSFTTQTVTSPAVTIEGATAVTGTTAHFAGEVTPGNVDPAFNAGCTFDFVTDSQFQADGFASAQQIPCAPLDPATGTVNGPAPVAVHADPENLEPNTVYHLRLRAENQGGQNTDVAATFETLKVAPGVQTLFAGKETATSAVLSGKVNPHNSAVTYQFEWGTDIGYGGLLPAAPAPLGASDNSLHLVTAELGGLQPGTTYHFRLVATNTETAQATQGPDHVFTTAGSPGPAPCANEVRRGEDNSLALPDCRAYELAMPATKDYPFGAANLEIAVAARQGGAVAYITYGPMPGAKAGTQENYNVARRGGSEWVNNPISPPQSLSPLLLGTPNTSAFSEDLNYTGLQAQPPLAGAPDGFVSLFREDTRTDAFTYLGPQSGIDAGGGNALVMAISEDGSHVIFYNERSAQHLFDYDFGDGQVHEVGLLPGGSVSEFAVLGQGGVGGSGSRVFRAVSADGSRIVWTDGSQIYDRVNGTETIPLSASKRAVPDPNGPGTALFWGASRSGDKVFFTTATALTESATVGGSTDLYRYDLGDETLTDLTAGADGKANVKGVIGNSDDGSIVYFVAGGALADGAEAGADNLYVARGGQITYIGSLDDADNSDWGNGGYSPGGTQGPTARVSVDGHLAFQSIARLTGYDNVDPVSGQPTSQIYVYSPGPGSLLCASCRPDGAAPRGNSTIRPPAYPQNVSRYISADGSRVFFNSTDAIVPADINGMTDVYEWTPGGVHLISDGRDERNSVFQDASADGDDVFFSTAARLVGQDTDSHVDLYDARVGGGYPRPPVTPAPCEGEGCRGPGSVASGGPSAATSAFAGPGNPRPDAASTQKVKRAKAMKACRRKSNKHKRKQCESQVKKRFAKKSGRGK